MAQDDMVAVAEQLDHMYNAYPDPNVEDGGQLSVVGTADTIGFEDTDVHDRETLTIERFDFGWRVRYASIGTISLRSPWVYGPTVAEALAEMKTHLV